MVVEDKGSSAIWNMFHMLLNPTECWLAEILEFALRTLMTFMILRKECIFGLVQCQRIASVTNPGHEPLTV